MATALCAGRCADARFAEERAKVQPLAAHPFRAPTGCAWANFVIYITEEYITL